jgi:hypothetical protein
MAIHLMGSLITCSGVCVRRFKVGLDLNLVATKWLNGPDNVLGPVPGVDVMAKRPQGLLNVGTLSARMAVLRSCALDI